MTINTVVASTTFSTETLKIDGVDFRIGFVEKMENFPYAISVTDITYGDGVNAGGVILSADDIRKCVEIYGKNFAYSFIGFILAHEVGHLIDFKNNPVAALTIGGLSISIDREIVADTYSIRNNPISLDQYRQFMGILLDEALAVEKRLCKKHRILYHIASSLDRRNLMKRFARTIESVKAKQRVSVNLIFGELSRKIVDGVIG